jgi:TonB family protein
MAELKGQSGDALVRVTIDHSGKITDYNLVQSSGSHILDREAVRTVERIGAFPATNFTSNDHTNVNLSLNYYLPKSFSENAALNRSLKNKGYVRSQEVASLGEGPVFASLQIIPSEEG